jgi:hypothetical protein
VKQSQLGAPATQLNIEVPFRNIGHIPLTPEEEKNDFALAFILQTTEGDCIGTKQQEMFAACRRKANNLVNWEFTHIAQAYYANRHQNYDEYTIKLAKLRSLFTLYYYIRAVEQTRLEGHVQKDSYELLPKVGVNDLIRNGLNDRDREVLVAVTGNTGSGPRLANCKRQPITFTQLKQQMNKDILECGKIISKNRPLHNGINAIHDAVFKPVFRHPRYTQETANAYGNGIKGTAPKPSNDENRFPKDLLHCRPDTPTFKPKQVDIYTYDKNKVVNGGREPVILFEVRHDNHPFSKVGKACMLVDALTQAHYERVKSITNLQMPITNRDPKQ